jgi:choline dehydrogenase-like flavoprotein
VKGLYVADASTFPSSSGVNPMITIMAIADHVARGMLDTW